MAWGTGSWAGARGRTASEKTIEQADNALPLSRARICPWHWHCDAEGRYPEELMDQKDGERGCVDGVP